MPMKSLKILILLAALIFLALGIYKLAGSIQGNQGQQQSLYHDWGKDWCAEDETRDYEHSSVKEITINFAAGCFHGPVTVPLAWQTFKARQTCNQGDWYQIWPDGAVEPYSRHPCSSYLDDQFTTYPGRGPSWKFRYQGKGTVTLYATTTR